jgi:hypothetical protein
VTPLGNLALGLSLFYYTIAGYKVAQRMEQVYVLCFKPWEDRCDFPRRLFFYTMLLWPWVMLAFLTARLQAIPVSLIRWRPWFLDDVWMRRVRDLT